MSALCRTPDTTHWLPLELYGSRETLYSGTFEGATLFVFITMMKKNQNTKAAIRQSIRLERAKLSFEEQREKAKKLTAIVTQLSKFLNSQHIAAYWPNDGEISPLYILAAAEKIGKSCYLPRLDSSSSILQMQFVEYHSGDHLTHNFLGILEPALLNGNRKSISAELLDLVLVPLVAFDGKGQRLGMGKGYYDHTFSFLKTNLNLKQKPFLLGVAYDLQRVLKLPSEAWDIPLDSIATESYYLDLEDLS